MLNCTWLFWYSLVHFINRYWFRSCLEVKSLIQILFSALLFLFNFQISLYKTPSKIIPPLMEDSPFRPEQEIEGRSSIRGITVPSLWNHSFLRTWSYIQIKGKLWPKAGKTIFAKNNLKHNLSASGYGYFCLILFKISSIISFLLHVFFPYTKLRDAMKTMIYPKSLLRKLIMFF